MPYGGIAAPATTTFQDTEAFGCWLPSIIKATGVSSTLEVGVLSAIPYAFGVVAMVVVG